ncbi:hypothetical protein Tco_1323900, partial [Tanacetum coccineum]
MSPMTRGRFAKIDGVVNSAMRGSTSGRLSKMKEIHVMRKISG